MEKFRILSRILMLMFSLILLNNGNAQNVGINTSGAAPDASAMLDITSTSKGLLIPRVSLTSLTDASTIASPAVSLLVYNSNASLTGGVGYYFNSGTSGSPVWTKLVTGGAGNGTFWGVTGNSGTTAGTNFVGTTDEEDLVLKTNGTSRVNVTSDGITTIGSATDNLKILADGTISLEGTATVWDDIMIFPDATSRGGSNTPTWGGNGGNAFKKNAAGTSQGVFLWMFSASSEQELYFVVQIPHGYKEGSTIYPHVHWTTASGTPSGSNVVWGLEYTAAAIGNSYSTTTSITSNTVIGEIGTPSGTGQHLITALGTISGTGLGISSVIVCRLYRAAADAQDSFANETGLLGIDFHYELDTFGSASQFEK